MMQQRTPTGIESIIVQNLKQINVVVFKIHGNTHSNPQIPSEFYMYRFTFNPIYIYFFPSCFPDDLALTPWDSSESYGPRALPWVSGLIFYNNKNNNIK